MGASTYYTFKISSPFILYAKDIVYIEFPTDLNVALSSSYTACAGIVYLSNTLTCTLSGTYGIYVTVALSGSVSSIPAKAIFSLKITGV